MQTPVSFYSHMGVRASRNRSGIGGGWRLYVFAKALDVQGLGMVEREALRRFMRGLGVSRTTWKNWIAEARNHDLVQDVQRKDGAWMLILPNAAKAGYALKCETIGRKVTMDAADLIGTGWRARVWAAYEATHNGRPISRERLQKITNIPVRTQAYRDTQAGVIRHQNYVNSGQGRDALPMLKEYSYHKGLLVSGNGKVYWRIPDNRSTDIALRGGRGRARKANRQLKRLNGLFQTQQALSDGVKVVIRLFHYSPKSTAAAIRKLSKTDNRRVSEVYEYMHESKNGKASSIWMPVCAN